ncbi:hypothetical protein Tco_0792519 [Tanacetum coccineum]
MANLQLCDTHNMVAYLKKPERSEGFHQIVEFLKSSHIKYALTENPTIYESFIIQFWQTTSASTLEDEEVKITATIDGQLKTVTKASLRRHLKLKDGDGISSLPNTEIFEQLVLMGAQLFRTHVADEAASTRVDVRYGGTATTVSSLDTEQGSGNIDKTPSMAHDLPLPRVNTLGSDEGKELMVLCTKLSNRVKKLEKTVKSNQARRKARIVVSDDEEEDSSKQGRKISTIDEDPIIELVQHDAEFEGRNEYKFEVYIAGAAVSTVGVAISTVEPVSTANVPIATAGISTTEPISSQQIDPKDKGKGMMVEPEKPPKKNDQIKADEELAQKLYEEEQARFNAEQEAKFNTEQEELLAYETTGDEANPSVANVDWDDVQAQIQADEDLAQRMLEEERENLSIAERARLLAELIDKRKKIQAAQRYEENRNKPQTMSQQRKTMCTYMKNMAGYKMEQFKGKSFYEIKEMLDKVYKQVTLFVPMDSGSVQNQPDVEEKELSQEDLQQIMMVVPVEEVYVEALQVKYLIIDWEIYTEDTRKYWKIIRVGNHTEVYQFFDDMLKAFDRDDLVKLWSLVRERFSSTDPTDDKERSLWVELKRLFEPDADYSGIPEILSVKYPIVDWESQNLGSVDMEDIHIGDEKDWTLISWKLYENCGVHSLLLDGTLTCFNMLVEKRYPLIKEMLKKMLNWKLKAEAESTMAFELLKFIKGELLGIMDFYNLVLLIQLDTAGDGSQQWSLVKIDIKDLKFLKETYSPPPPLRFPHTTYGKIRIDDDLHDLSFVEVEFPAIVINDAFAPQDALQCKSQVSTPFNDEIDFRISFDEFDDEDYTIIYDKNLFFYKMISVNNLKTDSEKDNEKVIPSIPSPEPAISCFDDLDFFNDFENKFYSIVYNDAQTSKSYLLT